MTTILKTNNPAQIQLVLEGSGHIINGKIIGLLPPRRGSYYSQIMQWYELPFEDDGDALIFKLKNDNLIFV